MNSAQLRGDASRQRTSKQSAWNNVWVYFSFNQ